MGFLLPILAESEPFYKHPVVLVIIVVVVLSLALSILAGLLKLVGVSLLMVLLFPLTSRIGRFLLLGLLVGIGASSFLREQLERFIKPEISATDALKRVEKLLEEDPGLVAHLRFGGSGDPARSVTDAASALASPTRALRGLRDMPGLTVADDDLDDVLRAFDRIADETAALKEVRTELRERTDVFSAALVDARKKPSAENVKALCKSAGQLHPLLKKERRILSSVSSERTSAREGLDALGSSVDDVPVAAGAVSALSGSLERLDAPLSAMQEQLKTARRTVRRIRKLAVRRRIVDVEEDETSETGPAHTFSGSGGAER